MVTIRFCFLCASTSSMNTLTEYCPGFFALNNWVCRSIASILTEARSTITGYYLLNFCIVLPVKSSSDILASKNYQNQLPCKCVQHQQSIIGMHMTFENALMTRRGPGHPERRRAHGCRTTKKYRSGFPKKTTAVGWSRGLQQGIGKKIAISNPLIFHASYIRINVLIYFLFHIARVAIYALSTCC